MLRAWCRGVEYACRVKTAEDVDKTEAEVCLWVDDLSGKREGADSKKSERLK
jgi:hypothetical protein